MAVTTDAFLEGLYPWLSCIHLVGTKWRLLSWSQESVFGKADLRLFPLQAKGNKDRVCVTGRPLKESQQQLGLGWEAASGLQELGSLQCADM